MIFSDPIWRKKTSSINIYVLYWLLSGAYVSSAWYLQFTILEGRGRWKLITKTWQIVAEGQQRGFLDVNDGNALANLSLYTLITPIRPGYGYPVKQIIWVKCG